MARPKKNGAEQPLNLDGNNMPMENENAPQSQENAAQQQSEEQVEEQVEEHEEEHEEENEFPFEVEGLNYEPEINTNGSFVICAPYNIEARKGRIEVVTYFTLKEGYRGLIVPITDNAINGLPTESDYRLQHSDVISIQVGEKEKVKLVLSINDETMIQEQTNFGSRSRNLIIPKGTPLAVLMVFKL
uniref:hypothetical protein n=1 Tax=Prevotella sp. TaxID=59823 RepID=UPI004029BF6B